MSMKLCPVEPLRRVSSAIWTFYSLFLHYYRNPKYQADEFTVTKRTRIHVYSWALVFRIWDIPHYRNGSFVEDMAKNLRNVALPGTFLPLSAFVACGKLVALIIFLIAYPLICTVAAVIAQKKIICYITQGKSKTLICAVVLALAHSVADSFCSFLLEPEDWFSLWQLNCRLASFHASRQACAKGYLMEDKYLFQRKAEECGVPVVPLVELPTSSSRLVLKDRNEEGGMGIHFFDLVGGEKEGSWICQPALSNSTFVASLLPANAPLSTFRVITGSRGGGLSAGAGENPDKQDVVALSLVFRAGRAGAKTDHSSILFDCADGVMGEGTTNAHWYIVGWSKLVSKWKEISCFSFGGEYTAHPDTGKTLKGIELGERYEAMRALCVDAHRKMMPDVPLAGWDVALTEDLGGDEEKMVLLEANLSCNFFRGTFDKGAYFDLVDEYFALLGNSKQA